MSKDNPICEICTGWMEERGEWLVCMSCKFQKKSRKIKVTPLPKKRAKAKDHTTFNDIGQNTQEDKPGINELVDRFNAH